MNLAPINQVLINMARVQGMYLTLTIQDIHRVTPAGITTETLIEHMIKEGWERHPIGHNFILEIHDKSKKE